MENEDQKKHGIKADLQLGRAVFAPGRLEKSPHTKELLHTVSVTSGETGFLCHWGCQVQVFSWWKARHCFENNLCGGTRYLHTGILSPWASCSHGFVHSSHKLGVSQYKKKKRELSNHTATARALEKEPHIRHVIKTTRTWQHGAGKSASLEIPWTSHSRLLGKPIAGCRSLLLIHFTLLRRNGQFIAVILDVRSAAEVAMLACPGRLSPVLPPALRWAAACTECPTD